ncbi:P-loop NTPase fold protein [Candidatus Nitrosocosmicus arcticus]
MLDIEWFDFIIGLSKKTLEKIISIKLEKSELKDIGAQEYLRKIIQL